MAAGGGIAPTLSDAELVAVAVMQALLGFTSTRRWLRYPRAHLRHLLGYPAGPATTRGHPGPAGMITVVIRTVTTRTAVWDR